MSTTDSSGLGTARILVVDDDPSLREALGRSLAEPGATLGGTCHLVTDSLRHQGEDDITLVLARIRG